MLVPLRKNHESVVVGDQEAFGEVLKVTVLDARRGGVRLGFDVGADVPVHRWEVWQKISASNSSALAIERCETSNVSNVNGQASDAQP